MHPQQAILPPPTRPLQPVFFVNKRLKRAQTATYPSISTSNQRYAGSGPGASDFVFWSITEIDNAKSLPLCADAKSIFCARI